MRRVPVLMILCASVVVAQSPETDELTATVTAMARVGRAFSPSLSPDGSEIAFISDLSGLPQLWVVSSQSGWPRMLTAASDPVSGVSWSPDGKWIAYVIAPGGGMNTQVYVMRPDGSGVRRLTDGGKENNWLGPWSRDGSLLAVSSNRRSADAMDCYVVRPDEGTLRLVARNPGVGTVTDISADNRHVLVDRVETRGDNNVVLVEIATGGETLLTPHEPPAQSSAEFSPDGTIWIRTNIGRDLFGLGRMHLGAGGKPTPIELVAERPDAELDEGVLDRRGTVAALVWNHAGRSELSFLDPRTLKITPGPKVPAELIGSFDVSQDGSLLALTISGSTTTPDIWVLDRTANELRQVTFSPHVGVDPDALVRPELLSYRAHDGLELSGWLYRPRNATGPLPMVLSFHGGPEGQERPAFRSDYQALVSQGIGVFAPNVRGSAGFGRKFVNLDNGKLRVDGVRDIRSTVEYLVQAGIADGSRIGITGGSYGGYMTMAGLTEFPDLFAAGVDLFGIFNFETFFKHTEPWMAAISKVEYGDPDREADMLRALSPIHKVDRITAPTMVLHGANDTNVPVVEAEQVVDLLRKRAVPVEYVLFPDEGHGWRKVANRIRSTVEMTRFFVRYLKRPS